VDDLDGLLPNEPADDASRQELREQPAREAEGRPGNAARKRPACAPERPMQQRIRDEVETAAVFRKEFGKLVAGARVDDEMHVEISRAQNPEVVQRQDRLATEPGRGMLRDDDDPFRRSGSIHQTL
jgi:hypothetical protein